MKNFKIFLLIFILLTMVGLATVAQEAPPAEVTEAVNLDENIQPADLGVGEPRVLPTNPLYFFKDIARGIRAVFAFNPVTKAELRLEISNEKLIEAKKLAEIKPEAATEALESYKVETDQLKAAVEKIPIGAVKEAWVDNFLNKFVDNSLKQQKLFGKFEKELPPETYEDIKKIQDNNLANFSDVGLKLASAETLQTKIVKTTEEQAGSDFKQFKNLEVLQAVAEKVPEEAKPAIQQAIDNSFNRLKGDLESLSPEDREKFKDYVENIGGNEVRHLAIMDEFQREELSQIVREETEKAKQRILERVETRLKDYGEKNLETAQKEYVAPLTTQGQLEDLRVIKTMENNLSPEVIQPILSAKQTATTKVIETLAKAETPEQQKPLFEKIESKYYDVQQLEIFKEIDELIPPENKELYEKLKEKAMVQMKAEVEKAKRATTEAKPVILDKLAGDSPEQIKILAEYKPPQEVIQQTVENIARKVEIIEDPAKVEILKQKLSEKEIKKVVEPVKPEIISTVEGKSEVLIGNLDQEKVAKQMAAAKNTIEACGRTTDPLEPTLRDYIRNNPPYKTLMEAAFKHLTNAEKALAEKNYGEAFGQATAATQQAANACKAVSDTTTKKITEDDRFNKWKELIKKLYEIAPEVFPPGYDEKAIINTVMLINCPLPDLSIAKACKESGGQVKFLGDPNRCSFFECQGQVKEFPCAGEGQKVNRDPAFGPVNQQCCVGLNEIRVSKSYSICKREMVGAECQTNYDCPQPLCPGLTSKCVEGKCQVPICEQIKPMTPIKENVLQTGECQLGAEQYYKCPDGTPVVRCKCTAEGKWDCLSNPENSCPVRKTVTEIRYYKCPDGTQVKWCECFEGGCACLMSPENSCPLTNQPPVTPGEVCQTLKETKYYQCPDGQTIPWCMCAPEGNFTGALNKWQCQRFPELSCPKPVVAPTPTPTEPMIACCIEGGACVYETKEHCLLKKGTPASSCSPNPCPQPIIEPTPKPVCIQVITPAMGPDGTCKEFSTPCDVPTGWKQVDKCPAVVQPTPQPTTTVSTECKAGETKKYTCPDGTLVEHCKCTSEGKWDCLASPEKSCPVSPTTTTPSATTEKILTITSPNGGETWYMGKTYDILWKSSGVERVNIEVNVFKDGVPVGTLSIAGSDLITLASAGKYSWTLSSQHLKEGNQFKIVIRNAETPYTPEDESDAYFSIIDTTPPVISAIAVYNITSSSAKIEWETNESATSQVIYGTTDIYHTGDEIKTTPDSSLLIHHSVSLSNLQPDTLYHYRVESKDAANNLTVSDSAAFTTAAAQVTP